jgi:hypothetical protein
LQLKSLNRLKMRGHFGTIQAISSASVHVSPPFRPHAVSPSRHFAFLPVGRVRDASGNRAADGVSGYRSTNCR